MKGFKRDKMYIIALAVWWILLQSKFWEFLTLSFLQPLTNTQSRTNCISKRVGKEMVITSSLVFFCKHGCWDFDYMRMLLLMTCWTFIFSLKDIGVPFHGRETFILYIYGDVLKQVYPKTTCVDRYMNTLYCCCIPTSVLLKTFKLSTVHIPLKKLHLSILIIN